MYELYLIRVRILGIAVALFSLSEGLFNLQQFGFWGKPLREQSKKKFKQQEKIENQQNWRPNAPESFHFRFQASLQCPKNSRKAKPAT